MLSDGQAEKTPDFIAKFQERPGPVNTKMPTVKSRSFPKGKGQKKIGPRRIEHTLRSIFYLQHSHWRKGGLAAGGLGLTGPKAF